jgi:hypothetical protein
MEKFINEQKRFESLKKLGLNRLYHWREMKRQSLLNCRGKKPHYFLKQAEIALKQFEHYKKQAGL